VKCELSGYFGSGPQEMEFLIFQLFRFLGKDDHIEILQGKTEIPAKFLCSPISYKYQVLSKESDTPEFEELNIAANNFRRNRLLVIPNERINGKYKFSLLACLSLFLKNHLVSLFTCQIVEYFVL